LRCWSCHQLRKGCRQKPWEGQGEASEEEFQDQCVQFASNWIEQCLHYSVRGLHWEEMQDSGRYLSTAENAFQELKREARKVLAANKTPV